MDSQADHPFGGGAGPAGGEGEPSGGGQQPHPGPPPSGGGQQPYSGPQPYPDPQPYGGGQQPYAGQQPYPDPQPYGGQQPYSGQQYPGPQPYGASPPPYGGPTAAGRPKVRPGRIWYLAALAVFLGGVAWLVFGLLSIGHQIDSFPRVPLPAGGSVTLNHSGGYVIYYEGPGAKSGQIPGFHVRIVPAASSPQMGSLKSYSGSLTYSFGSHQGRAVLTLQVARGGRFLVQPFGAPSHSDLAFGSSIASGIVGTVLGSIALILVGIAAAIVLLVIRILKTRRARAAAMQPTWQQATGQ